MINIFISVKESLWYLLIVGVLKRCRCEVMLRNFHHKQTKQENKSKKMHSNTNNAPQLRNSNNFSFRIFE